MKIVDHYSLDEHTSFHLPAVARRALLVGGDEDGAEGKPGADVEELLASPFLTDPYLVLGGGSNMVFTSDYPGTVLKVEGRSLHASEERIVAGAGASLDEVVRLSISSGCYGAENLAAIPGTAGGAVVQNAGAYGTETGRWVEWVEAVDLHRLTVVRLRQDECCFGYRTSLFKTCPGRYLILKVGFRFAAEFIPNLTYKALADELCRRGITNPTQQQMYDLVTELRWSKLPRPEQHGSAGSFFKNPVVDETTYARLRAACPDMPASHSILSPSTGRPEHKLSAGWLIDRCGWKGRTLGRAGVWPQQALVLYNAGHCTGPELMALAQAIQHDVKQTFGITLEPEAIII